VVKVRADQNRTKERWRVRLIGDGEGGCEGSAGGGMGVALPQVGWRINSFATAEIFSLPRFALGPGRSLSRNAWNAASMRPLPGANGRKLTRAASGAYCNKNGYDKP
jgi:hypothetical protein